MAKVLIVTTENVPGYEVSKVLGVVYAPVAMARWFGADIMAGLRDIFGGKVGQYEKLMGEALKEAFDRLAKQAEDMGADAIIGVRIFSPEIGGTRNIGEVVVYGTAVKLSTT